MVEKFLERVDRLKTDVHDLSTGLEQAFAQSAYQIFGAMRYAGDALQSHLGGAAFYRVYGAEQSIDVLGVGIGFQREQAVLNNLQMLFSFGNKEFKNLIRHFILGFEIGDEDFGLM